jgi:hypothetical protein
MSRVAFRVFPAGRAGDMRAAIIAISCFVSRFRVYVCMYFLCGRSQAAQESEFSEPRPFFSGSFVGASISYLVGVYDFINRNKNSANTNEARALC